MISYAVKRGISDVYLLYPLYRFEENEPNFPVALSNLSPGVQVRVHLVRLPFVFEDDVKKTKERLTMVINEIFND